MRLDAAGQRKTPRVAGLDECRGWNKSPMGTSGFTSIIVEGDEAPKERGLGAGGVPLADEFGGVDRYGGGGGGLERIGGDGESPAEERGFFAARRRGAGGATGAKQHRGCEQNQSGAKR